MKRIREMMKQNKNKREVNMHKQQLNIIDSHEKLLDKGFKVGYTTVRNFVNREEKKPKEVFSRQEPTAAPFNPAELVELRVDKHSTVTYLHNR